MRDGLKAAIVAVIVLVIILVVAIAIPTGRRYQDFLTGIWAGDPLFLASTGLSSLQIYLAPAEGGTRQGYLLMTNDAGEFIANSAFDLSFDQGGVLQNLQAHFRPHHQYHFNATLEFDSKSAGELANVIPSDITVNVCPAEGTFSLRDDKKIYAYCHKDALASMSAETAWADGAAQTDAPDVAAQKIALTAAPH